MADAFARFLPHFGPDGAPSRSRAVALSPAPPAEPLGDPLAEAEERGRVAGRSSAIAEFTALRADDAALAAQALADARSRWADEEGERLATGFRDGLMAIEAAIAAHVAEILAPFVSEAVRTRAVADLAAVAAELLGRNEGVAMRVAGPGDLLAAFGLRLGADAERIDFVPGIVPEFHAQLRDTVVETRLAAWLGRVEAAVSC